MAFKFLPQMLASFSIAEVLIVLLIAAMALVTVEKLTVQLEIQVKNNEIGDFTNAIILQALEIAKSPGDVVLTSAAGNVTSYNGSYSIDLNATPRVLWKQSSATSVIPDCPSGSAYEVSVTSLSSAVATSSQQSVCLQIIIIQKTGLVAQTYYEIQARSVYQRAGLLLTNDAYGYRRALFATPAQQTGAAGAVAAVLGPKPNFVTKKANL